MLAELERGLAAVPLEREREPRVLQGRGEPLLRRGVRPLGAPGQEIARLREQPRVPERAARDHDAGAPGVPPHG